MTETENRTKAQQVTSVLLTSEDNVTSRRMSFGNNDSKWELSEKPVQQKDSESKDECETNGNDNALLNSQQKPRTQSVGLLTRSSSAPWRGSRNSVTPTCRSTAVADVASDLRFRGIISSARYSVLRGSVALTSLRSRSAAYTEGEAAAYAQMKLKDERRLAAKQRVSEEDERRGQMLIAQEIEKETSSLSRLIDLEKQKIRRLRECKEKQLMRMLQAKQRREMMERERQRELDLLRRRREQRVVLRDPYAMRAAVERYKKPNAH